MSLLLQISDTHFGTEIASVVDALLELAQAQTPSVVVVSGDITQRARRAQFAAAQRCFAELARAAHALLVIPGNHDIPLFNVFARLSHPYRNYTRAFGSALEPSYESDELLVLGVNTTRWFRRKHGQVSDEQIARVAARLSRARPQQLRVVVTHQPLQVIRERDLNNLLRGHERAARTWSDAGADILLGGHIHLPYMRPLRDVQPDLARQTYAVQAGTAVSKRIRDGVPNSINLIRYGEALGAACVLERWDYTAESRAFRMISSGRLPLTRDEPQSASQLVAAAASEPRSG